jgi:hypothetical protein
MDDIDAWRDEILAVSNIVQDDDESVSDEEAERRFNRFIELVDAVQGDEPTFLTSPPRASARSGRASTAAARA